MDFHSKELSIQDKNTYITYIYISLIHHHDDYSKLCPIAVYFLSVTSNYLDVGNFLKLYIYVCISVTINISN